MLNNITVETLCLTQYFCSAPRASKIDALWGWFTLWLSTELPVVGCVMYGKTKTHPFVLRSLRPQHAFS